MADFSIILMDKEPGETSFQSLGRIKRERKGVKVGHAGTLDRFASGLMVVLTGGATKLNPIFSSFDKEYIASVHFGEETDTLDPEGEVIAQAAPPEKDLLESIIPSFLGPQKQVPPLYSAIHVDGKRAYKEARRGRNIEMPERDICISAIDLLSYDGREAIIRVSVSKGTYIRSLARDIALKAGSRAHLSALRRLRIGPWTLDDSTLSSVDLLKKTGLVSEIKLRDEERKLVENGSIRRRAVISDSDADKPYSFISFSDGLFGIGEKRDGGIRLIARLG